MTEQDKSEMIGLMSDVMQKFANEYMQPQFTALQNEIDVKYTELKQEIADVRTELKDTRQELKQEIADVRQELKDTRQELKFEIKKLQKDSEKITQDVEGLMSWKRDLTAACNMHQEVGGVALG